MFCKKYKEALIYCELANRAREVLCQKLQKRVNMYKGVNKDLRKSNRGKDKTIHSKDKTILNLEKSIKEHIKLENKK